MRKKKKIDRTVTIQRVKRDNEIIDDICKILLEGETNTKIGLSVTINRIKETVNFNDWLNKNLDQD